MDIFNGVVVTCFLKKKFNLHKIHVKPRPQSSKTSLDTQLLARSVGKL